MPGLVKNLRKPILYLRKVFIIDGHDPVFGYFRHLYIVHLVLSKHGTDTGTNIVTRHCGEGRILCFTVKLSYSTH